MIAHIRGKLIAKHPTQAVVEAGGVGYDLNISVPAYSELPATGAEVAMHIHTHVREDALQLFGFLRLEEKRLFERLITVSGVGPRLAITMLSGISADALAAAIRGNQVAQLTRIPGIGRKTAERLILELRDKLEIFAATPAAAASPVEEDVLSALVNLGYQRAAAERALAAVTRNGKEPQPFESLFRDALAALAR